MADKRLLAPYAGPDYTPLEVAVLDTANGQSVAIPGDGSDGTLSLSAGVHFLESDVAARVAYGDSPASHPVRFMVGPNGGRPVLIDNDAYLVVSGDGAGTLNVIPAKEIS